MALFGRKKPQELYAEAKKLTDLIYDWLMQPMRQYHFSVSDGVQTEYYLLAICSYLAQEKISSAAREHLHTAVVESSTYGKKYVKDKQKEYGFMAVLLNTFKTEERSARRAGQNVLSALVTQCFRDFSKYEEPEKVRRCVHNTINLFNEEIPTTDYARLRLPVPTAPAPARSSYAPAAPSRTAAPVQERKADYILRDEKGNPMYYDKMGDPVSYEGATYQIAQQQGDSNGGIIFLRVSGNQAVLVTDERVIKGLAGQLLSRATQNALRSKRPGYFDLRSGATGERRRVNVMGWVDRAGRSYAVTRWADSASGVVVLEWKEGQGASALPVEKAREIIAIFQQENPGMLV